MKKFIFIFFLIILLILSNKEKLQPVFYEESMSFYELELKDCNITTINLSDKLSKLNIKKLYPYIDSSYKNILKHNLDYYDVNNINDLDDFVDYYKNLLKKIGKNNLANLVNYKGVPIEKVIVYDMFSNINSSINKNKCIYTIKEI